MVAGKQAQTEDVSKVVREVLERQERNSAEKKTGGDLSIADKVLKDAPTPTNQPEASKQRLKHGEPTVSTPAVAVDDLEAKTAFAAGEEGREARPLTLKPGLQDVRKIIRTAEVSLEVDSYEATYTKLSELVTAEKGLVSSASTQKAANGKVQATVILRVPPERFESVLTRLKEFGTVRSQNVDSEDVTKAYVDLETRRKSKEILADRLSKLLAEGKGTVKELMEVEVQLGATNEAIEQIKGEIKYYDNRIALSSLTLQISEKDFGQPFEFVQTLQANLALTVRDPDLAYTKAQKEITEGGGQVVDSRMNRQSDGSSTGTIRGRVDADKFQALRESLKLLGVTTNDTVNQQKTARGGHEGLPRADAPLRKEQAVLDLTVSSPPIFVTRRAQLVVETAEVEAGYQSLRKSVEGSGARIADGSLTGRAERMVAVLKIQADADRFAALMESLKAAGKVKHAAVSSVLPTAAADGGAPLLRERAEVELTLVSPAQLIGEENGLLKTIRNTFAGSWSGFLWSVEKLFVGISLAGPWLVLPALGIFFWRRRRKKSASSIP
jgi:glycine cleavage system regulatory protein